MADGVEADHVGATSAHLRAAFGYLAEHSGRNVGLDELAAVAGVGRFQLIDAFREGTGLAPHAFQLARRLLEGGATIADTAAATGFADQSHLHRHFRRSLGMTPREYQHRFVAGREEQTRLCSRRRSTGQVTRPVAPGWSSTP